MVEVLYDGETAPDKYQKRVHDWLEYAEEVTGWNIDLNAVRFERIRGGLFGSPNGQYLSPSRDIVINNKTDLTKTEMRRVFFHELTHHVHYMNELLDPRDYDEEEEYLAAFMLSANETIKGWKTIPFKQVRRDEMMDSYAGKNPVEFVAVAGEKALQNGRSYSPMFLRCYEQMRGPPLPECDGYDRKA